MIAVFFDIDGTLFDTRGDLAATVNHARRDLGLVEWPEEAVIEHVGQGAKHLLDHAIPERMGDSAVGELFRKRYVEHCCDTATPYAGVERTLEELRRRGYKLGVNTNKPNFAVSRLLEKFGMRRFFGDAIVAGGDGVELKPSAQSIRECAARMGGHQLAGNDWMVGDSWTDMECAANAGVKAAFCTYGFGKLKESRYDQSIDRFEELLSFIKDEEQENGGD